MADGLDIQDGLLSTTEGGSTAHPSLDPRFFATSLREVKRFLALEIELNDEWQAATTVRLFRVGQWLHHRRHTGFVRMAAWRVWVMVERCWFHTALGADIPATLACGLGVRFAHGGRGVILHPYVRVGERCTIYHNVTAGIRGLDHAAPSIGDDVTLGAGCVVLGPITIGDGAAVGPNAVIVSDVPPGAHVVAATATTLSSRVELSGLRSTASGRVVRRVESPGS